jgi:PEP-CTERM motif
MNSVSISRLCLRKVILAACSLLFMTAFLLLSSRECRADDIVVTGGYVAIGGAPLSRNAWAAVSFNFSGAGFAASGGAPDSLRQGINSPCALFELCTAGQTIFPNSTAFLDGPGQATFNGTTVGAWWFARSSTLSFSGPGVVIPDSTEPALFLTTPFVMTGSVFVSTLDNPGPVVFSTTISGSGIATLELRFFPQLGSRPAGYAFSNVRYDFEPVPEPVTLIMLGTGLAGLAAGFRRRRRGQNTAARGTES